MTREDLKITPDLAGGGVLHDGPTRHATLVQLVANWAEDRSQIIDALDALASVVASYRAPEGAVDAAVGDVESEARMDLPDVLLSRTDLGQLVKDGWEAFEPPRRISRPPLAAVAGSDASVRGAA